MIKKKIRFNPKYLRVLSRHPSHKIIRNHILVPEGITACVRFGSNTPGNYDVEINTVESIENTKNKFKMKELFTKAKVSSPLHFKLDRFGTASTLNVDSNQYEDVDISEYLGENQSLLAKRTYRSKGVGMLKINTIEEYNTFIASSVSNNRYNTRNPYYLEVFKNYSREYRIHVSVCGNYFYANRKMLRKDFQNTKDNWYRNDSNSVWFLENNELFDKPLKWEEMIQDLQKARAGLGLDICGFDVKTNKKGDWQILEANSACSFGDTTNKVTYVSSVYLAELGNIIIQKIFKNV